MSTINLKDVPSGEFTSMPENWYGIKATKTELTVAASSGNQMIVTEFDVISPPEYAKRKVWANFTITPKSLWFLNTFLESAGSDYAGQDNIDPDELAEKIVGMTCEALLIPDVSNTGKPVNVVKNFRKFKVTTQTTSQPASVKKQMFE